MSKIRQKRNFTIIDKKPEESQDTGDNSNKQGVSKFIEVPSNGQDEVKQGKKGANHDASDEEEEEETKVESIKLQK